MANLRVVYNNALSRASTLTASTTAGSLIVDNLKSSIKSEVWRSTSTTSQLSLTWSSPEIIGCVALPFGNFTSTSTIRARVYTNIGDATPVYDSGNKFSCPSQEGTFYWGMTSLGVNAYTQGGSSTAVIWFTPVTGKQLVIDLVDTSNSSGYTEAANLVCGSFWEPSVNCQYGASVSMNDMSKNDRTDAGDLRTDRGPMYKSLSFDLQYLPVADRNSIWQVMLSNGIYKPVFISLSPQDTDVTGEQMFQIYGKLSKSSALKYQYIGQFETQIDIEEV